MLKYLKPTTSIHSNQVYQSHRHQHQPITTIHSFLRNNNFIHQKQLQLLRFLFLIHSLSLSHQHQQTYSKTWRASFTQFNFPTTFFFFFFFHKSKSHKHPSSQQMLIFRSIDSPLICNSTTKCSSITNLIYLSSNLHNHSLTHLPPNGQSCHK